MVAKAWGSRRQCAFLTGRGRAFLTHQGDKALARQFWPELVGDFFTIWPDQEAENADFDREAEEDAKGDEAAKTAPNESQPSEKRAKRKRAKAKTPRVPPVFETHEQWVSDRTSKLRNWFYNHVSKKAKSRPAVSLAINAATALGPRGLTEDQIYSKKYYHERVRPLVEAEVAANAVDSKKQISVRAKLTRQCYDQESEEIKAEIRLEKQAEDQRRRETLEMLQSLTRPDKEREYTPEEYARYQAAAGDLIECFFEALAPKTGWAWTVLGGGPQSAQENGKNAVVSFHRGATQDGLKFSVAFEGFDEKVVVPFGQYCHRIFPEEIRLQRAVTITAAAEGREALVRSNRGVGTLVYAGDAGRACVVAGRGSASENGSELGTGREAGDNGDVGTVGEIGPVPLGDERSDPSLELVVVEQGCSRPEDSESVAGGEVEALSASAPMDGLIANLPVGEWTIPAGGAAFPAEEWMSAYDEDAFSMGDMSDGGDLRVWGDIDNVGDPGTGAIVDDVADLGTDAIASGVLQAPDVTSIGGAAGMTDLELDRVVEGEDGDRVKGAVDSKDEEMGLGKRAAEGVADRAIGREKRVRRGNRELDDWVGAAEGYLRRGVDDNRLTESGLRPVELAKWVGSRKWDADPPIDHLADYAVRWLRWWLAMQPASRKREGEEWPVPWDASMRKDMLGLKKAGPNGIVVLLVGLKWWAPLWGGDERWGAVVEDVVRCLEAFVVG
ncbi:hypothetical protein MD484_g7189, partial [Candolleomyces efflorescens]